MDSLKIDTRKRMRGGRKWDIASCSLVKVDRRFRGVIAWWWRQYSPLLPCSLALYWRFRGVIALMMRQSGTSANYETTRHSNPEGCQLHTLCLENLKSHLEGNGSGPCPVAGFSINVISWNISQYWTSGGRCRTSHWTEINFGEQQTEWIILVHFHWDENGEWSDHRTVQVSSSQGSQTTFQLPSIVLQGHMLKQKTAIFVLTAVRTSNPTCLKQKFVVPQYTSLRTALHLTRTLRSR
jgi:hypothetical protein